MSIPLAAIPLMAIFGIPRFAPVVASPQPADGHDAFDLPVDLGTEEQEPESIGAAEPWSNSGNDAPLYDPAEDQSAPVEFGPSAPTGMQDSDGLANRPQSLDSSAASRSSTATPPATGQLSWRDAARRLDELGVHDFQLRPGTQPDTFLFACAIAPNGDRRVVRRFESESADPLTAVGEVLTQIKEWRNPSVQRAEPDTTDSWGYADRLGQLGARR
jgi:hypothetical protein